MKKLASKIIPYYLRSWIRVNLLENFEKHPVILIYQMGKVGSSTIDYSLRKLKLPNIIYPVHFLSWNNLNRIKADFQKSKIKLPNHIITAEMLRKKIDAHKMTTNWKIITTVREPIARELSSFFHLLEYDADSILEFDAHSLLDQTGKPNIPSIIKFLHKEFADFNEQDNFTCSWFDSELKEVFDIDIYSYNFDKIKGFSKLKQDNVEILILRLEDINTNISEIADFLNIDHPIQIIKQNMGNEKKLSTVHGKVLSDLILPTEICQKIYSSKYVSHFYDEKMISDFIHKWSTARK